MFTSKGLCHEPSFKAGDFKVIERRSYKSIAIFRPQWKNVTMEYKYENAAMKTKNRIFSASREVGKCHSIDRWYTGESD